MIQGDSSVKRVADAKLKPFRLAMLDTLHEVAIYIHRFHNLDLFQQGWYQIKITMKWEDANDTFVGIPSKVVQYEAASNMGSGSGDSHGVWRIDDTDNSFFTQPFKIRYAKQDVPLSVMVAFNLSNSNREVPSKSGVIIKFELMHASLVEKGSELQASLSNCPAAVHEFRIPPKGLLGLHSYCPVLFDAFYAVLVDTSIHVSLMKSTASSNQKKVSSNRNGENNDCRIPDNSAKGLGKVEKEVMLVKALLTARDILLEETQKLSKAIDGTINLTDFLSQLDDTKLFGSSSTNSVVQRLELTDSQNSSQKVSLFLDFRRNGVLQSLSKDILLRSAHTIANQIYYLWSTFLNFHRANNAKIMVYLQELWANDRKTEWSIWMVHSKVEMPHHFISSGDEVSLNGTLRGKVSVLWRLIDDPAQTAATRAERHRRSIMHMKIDSRSIQDLQIFGDPSLVPVVHVERVINAPRRSCSGNSYFGHVDEKAPSSLVTELKTISKISGSSQLQNGQDLKIVVFVHGFQGHHLDLRLVRNQWLLIDPKAEFLMSQANEDKTSGDFREMGNRLAKEVVLFFKKKMDKMSRYGGLRSIKLSFVGHSIGNVIIRTALADSIMEPYLRFLYTYVSVSGPHLGYLYSSNSLFNSGLWLLKKLKSTQCIHQLTFTDDPDLQNTFFYKLCQQKTLENFKNIILLSSPQVELRWSVLQESASSEKFSYMINFLCLLISCPPFGRLSHICQFCNFSYFRGDLSTNPEWVLLRQDGYVPYHSARIELCPASSTDFSKRGKVFLEMLNNCLDQIRCPSVEHRVFMRCDVNFNMSTHGKNLNTFIGRAAHIEFLETDIFAKFIMWSFRELFS